MTLTDVTVAIHCQYSRKNGQRSSFLACSFPVRPLQMLLVAGCFSDGDSDYWSTPSAQFDCYIQYLFISEFSHSLLHLVDARNRSAKVADCCSFCIALCTE